MGTTLSQEIAAFISGKEFADIPENVIEKAKQCLLDIIGVALYGAASQASIISLAFIKSFGSGGGATVLGAGYQAPAPLASFANGIRCHAEDFDDVLPEMKGHPSCAIAPAVLSLAETRGRGGQDLLAAFVLGVEIAAKLGRIMGVSHYDSGWHPTGTMGAVGATVAAAKIIGLSQEQTTHALGIAASTASGIRENFGTMTKCYHAGQAACTGATTALMAENGYEASAHSLDGEQGLIRAMQSNTDLPFPFSELGNPYSLLNVQIKKYPSCAGTHAAVDAILDLRKRESIGPADVTSLIFDKPSLDKSVLRYSDPRTELEAKFSLEYCVAAALVFGSLGPNEFNPQALKNKEVRRVMKRVHVNYTPEMEEFARKRDLLSPARIEVHLRDGHAIDRLIEVARGGPVDPLTPSEIEEKFLGCTERLSSASQVIGLIRRLEEQKDLNELMVMVGRG